MCTMLMGFFAVLSVVSTPPEPDKVREREDKEPELKDVFYIQKVWAVVKIMGLVFGYQGLQGLYTRDALKLKWLCFYYVLSFLLEVLSTYWYLRNACQVLVDLKPEIEEAAQHTHRRPLNCHQVQQAMFYQGVAQCTMFYFFARAAWSLASIYSSLQPTALLRNFSDMEVGMQVSLGRPLLDGASEPRQQQQQERQQQQQQRPKFHPFSGRRQRLD